MAGLAIEAGLPARDGRPGVGWQAFCGCGDMTRGCMDIFVQGKWMPGSHGLVEGEGLVHDTTHVVSFEPQKFKWSNTGYKTRESTIFLLWIPWFQSHD
jgi:hypothetical protein